MVVLRHKNLEKLRSFSKFESTDSVNLNLMGYDVGFDKQGI